MLTNRCSNRMTSIANRELLSIGSCRAALGLDGRGRARPHTKLRALNSVPGLLAVAAAPLRAEVPW